MNCKDVEAHCIAKNLMGGPSNAVHGRGLTWPLQNDPVASRSERCSHQVLRIQIRSDPLSQDSHLLLYEGCSGARGMHWINQYDIRSQQGKELRAIPA